MKKLIAIATLVGAFAVIAAFSEPLNAQETPNVASEPASKVAVNSDQQSVAKVAETIVSALNGQNVEPAFDVMTENGNRAFCAHILMSAVAMSDAAKSLPEDTKLSEESGITAEMRSQLIALKTAADKYGLSKINSSDLAGVNLGQLEEAGSSTIDQMIEGQSKVNDVLLNAVPKDQHQTAVSALAGMISRADVLPVKQKVVDIKMLNESARVGVAAAIEISKLPKDTDPALLQSAQEVADIPQNWLRIIKQDDQWKFDGFDLKYVLSKITEGLHRPSDLIIDNFELKGKSLSNEEIDLKDYRGKVVLVDFWGTWCPPCVAALDDLAQLHSTTSEKGLVIIGVADDSAAALKEFLNNKPLPWANIVDSDLAISTKYNIKEFPTTLLIDKEGNHVATNLKGEKLESAVTVLLSGGNLDDHFGNAKLSLERGLKEAKASNRRVLLHFGADWCGPCKLFEKWLEKPEVKALLSKSFVDVKVDVDKMRFAHEVVSKYTKENDGIPWFGFLDADNGNVLATSVADVGNIGLPASDVAIEHFGKMLKSTEKLSDEEIDQIKKSLVDFAVESKLR